MMSKTEIIIILKVVCKCCGKILFEGAVEESAKNQIMSNIKHRCEDIQVLYDNIINDVFNEIRLSSLSAPQKQPKTVEAAPQKVIVDDHKTSNGNTIGKLLRRTMVFIPCFEQTAKENIDECYQKQKFEKEIDLPSIVTNIESNNICTNFIHWIQKFSCRIGGGTERKKDYDVNCPLCKTVQKSGNLATHIVISCPGLKTNFTNFKLSTYAVEWIRNDKWPTADECLKLAETMLRNIIPDFDDYIQRDKHTHCFYVKGLNCYDTSVKQLIANATSLNNFLVETHTKNKLPKNRRTLHHDFEEMMKRFIESVNVEKDERTRYYLMRIYCLIYGGISTVEDIRPPEHSMTPFFALPCKFVSMKSAYFLASVDDDLLKRQETTLEELIAKTDKKLLTYIVFKDLPLVMARLFEFCYNVANFHPTSGNTYMGTYKEFAQLLEIYKDNINPVIRLGNMVTLFVVKTIIPNESSLFEFSNYLKTLRTLPSTSELETTCNFNGVSIDELLQHSLNNVKSISDLSNLFYPGSAFSHMKEMESPISGPANYARVKNPKFDILMNTLETPDSSIEILRTEKKPQSDKGIHNSRNYDLNEHERNDLPDCLLLKNITKTDCWLISAVNLITSASILAESIVEQAFDNNSSDLQKQLSDLIQKRQCNIRILRKSLNDLKQMSMDRYESASHGLINIFEYLDQESMKLVEYDHKPSTLWCECQNRVNRTHSTIKSNTLVLNANPNKVNTFWTIFNDFQNHIQICDICQGEITHIREISAGKQQKYLFITLNSHPQGLLGPRLFIDKADVETSVDLLNRKSTLIGAIEFVNGNHFKTWNRFDNGWLVINDDKKEYANCLPKDLGNFESLLFQFIDDDDLRQKSRSPALDQSFGNMSFNDIETHCKRILPVTFVEGQDIDDCLEGFFEWCDNIGTLMTNSREILLQDFCSHKLLTELIADGVQFGGYDIRVIPGASVDPSQQNDNGQATIDNSTSPSNERPFFEEPDIGSPMNLSFNNEGKNIAHISVQTSQSLFDSATIVPPGNIVGDGDNVTCDMPISKIFSKFKLNFNTSGKNVNGQWSKIQFERCFGEFPYVIRRRKGKKDYKQFHCPLCNRKDSEKALMEHLKKDHCFGKSRFEKEDLCPKCSSPITPTSWKKHGPNCFKKHFIEANIDRAKILDKQSLDDTNEEEKDSDND